MNKRKTNTLVRKGNFVLETPREDKPPIEFAHKFDVSQQLISRWKSELLANMPSVF